MIFVELIITFFTKLVVLAKIIPWQMLSLLISMHVWVAYYIGQLFFRLMKIRVENQEIDLARVNRVLVVRLDEIGDMVVTAPFLRELRRLLPNASITLVIKPALYNLLEFCPYVDKVLTYDVGVTLYFRPFKLPWRAFWLASQYFWSLRFNLAIVPRWETDNCYATFLAYFSGASWSVGYSEKVNERKQLLNSGFDHLFTQVLYDCAPKHEVERNLDIIRFLDGTAREDRLELWLRDDDEAFVEEVLISHRIHTSDLLIAFGPGAGAPKRMWPLANFVEVGEWLKEKNQVYLIVIGGQGEEVLGQELRFQLGDTVINIAGHATLRQTAALLKRCHLYVGNDSGPMHLAAAAGIPVVEISCHPRGAPSLHENSPSRFGPWGVPSVILQPDMPLAPCSDACVAAQAHCIVGVRTEQVKQAIVARLSRHGSSEHPQGGVGLWDSL